MPIIQPGDTSSFPQVILELELAGSKYYFSERGPQTISVDGVDVAVHPGLDGVGIEMSIDIFGTSPSSRSASVSVDLGTAIDVATLFSNGIALYAARAALYANVGDSLNNSQKLAGGFLKDPIYADPTDPNRLSFTIDRDFTERALYPSANAYLRDDSFSLIGSADSNDVGLVYPTPIGKPGSTDRSAAGVIKAMQAVRANVDATIGFESNARIVVALGSVIATTVKVWSGVNHSDTADLLTDTDEYGNLVTYIDLTSVGTPSYYNSNDTGPTHVAFTDEGIAGPSGEGMRGLGDVIVWALNLSSLSRSGDIDWNRVGANQDRLNKLGRIDTWISQRIKPLDWLVSDVLPYFPVFVADLGEGIFVDIWDYDPATPAELYIDTSIAGYERCAPVAWTSQTIANVISVDGALAASGDYFTSIVYSGDDEDLADNATLGSANRAVRSNPILRHSFHLFDRNELAVQVPTVYDSATLDRIGDFLSYKYALPTASVGYIIPWRKTSPRPGMRVEVTDPVAGFTNAKGVISGFRYLDGTLQVNVSMLPGV